IPLHPRSIEWARTPRRILASLVARLRRECRLTCQHGDQLSYQRGLLFHHHPRLRHRVLTDPSGDPEDVLTREAHEGVGPEERCHHTLGEPFALGGPHSSPPLSRPPTWRALRPPSQACPRPRSRSCAAP